MRGYKKVIHKKEGVEWYRLKERWEPYNFMQVQTKGETPKRSETSKRVYRKESRRETS